MTSPPSRPPGRDPVPPRRSLAALVAPLVTSLVAVVALTLPLLAVPAAPSVGAVATSADRRTSPLRLAVADRDRFVTRGRKVVVPVTVRNRGARPATRVRVRVVLPAGVTTPRATVPVGRLARGAERTIRVTLVLEAAAARDVVLRAARAGGGSAQTTVTLRPRPDVPPPTEPPTEPPPAATAWSGNFSGPTADGIHFTLSGDRTSITGWRAAEVDGYCAYQGSAFAWYPTAELPAIAVGADGRFDATFRFPPTDPDDFDETAHITGTVAGGSITDATLAYTATYDYGGSTAICTISNAQEVWSAAQG